MTHIPSERIRAIIAETLPLMEAHRSALASALGRYAARQWPDRSPPNASKATRAITDMLFGGARRLGESDPTEDLAESARSRRALSIGRETYSTFGDALKPVMQDVLGSRATPLLLAAWGTAYWAIVRRLFAGEARLAAIEKPGPSRALTGGRAAATIER